MKITKKQLRQIIKEELGNALKEYKEAKAKEPDAAGVGDYLVIEMTEGDPSYVGVYDGGGTAPEIGYKEWHQSLHCIAKVIKIADDNPEDL